MFVVRACSSVAKERSRGVQIKGAQGLLLTRQRLKSRVQSDQQTSPRSPSETFAECKARRAADKAAESLAARAAFTCRRASMSPLPSAAFGSALKRGLDVRHKRPRTTNYQRSGVKRRLRNSVLTGSSDAFQNACTVVRVSAASVPGPASRVRAPGMRANVLQHIGVLIFMRVRMERHAARPWRDDEFIDRYTSRRAGICSG